jgi:Domain of unknown function (DUF4419)
MSAIAPILEQTAGKICFNVDDVRPTKKQFPVQNPKSQIEQQFKKSIIAFSHDDIFETVESYGNNLLANVFYLHPLALAVDAAFNEHRPLLLTPDMIWIAIAQGFAHHINNNYEALRSQFVRHQNQKKLIVEIRQLPRNSQQWSEVVREWSLQIRDEVGAEIYQLLECNFTTTTLITKTVSHVVMMDAFQHYFEYVAVGICGIPQVTLLGTIADWQIIYDRVEEIARYELNWWTDRLLPICQQLIETAAGKPALEFWRHIYKPQLTYGANTFTGWLADLFPYLKHPKSQIPTIRNSILSIDRSQLTVDDGISLADLPSGLSQVAFKLEMRNKQQYNLELMAGFIGVSQNSDSGVLQPEIGWWVQEGTAFDELLDKIEREHLTLPPMNWSKFRSDTTSKELMQLLDRFDGATLYPNSDRSWKIPRRCDARCYSVSETEFKTASVQHLMDLVDGRAIVCIYQWRIGESWIAIGKPVTCDNSYENRLEEVTIIARGIPELFDRIFQAEGSYYFDELDFILSQL